MRGNRTALRDAAAACAVRRSRAGAWAVGAALASAPASAADATGAAAIGPIWGLPFVGLLLSIAILPLVAPKIWHHRYGAITALWSLAVLVPYGAVLGLDALARELIHVVLLDYMPFIILIAALFTVAGGLYIKGHFSGTPVSNTLLLATGTGMASFVGTTGASMLMIRPLIRANQGRPYALHVYIFFIFLVSNIGGALTPLGDPPLFIGFLQGVEFFWTTAALWRITLMAVVTLLLLFFVIDLYHHRREPKSAVPPVPVADQRFGLDGKINLALLAALIGIVLWSGIAIRFSGKLTLMGIEIPIVGLLRDAGLVAVAIASVMVTPASARAGNGFTFGPIIEVAKLFAGIFITMVPVLIMLRAGKDGPLASLVALVTGPDGRPDNVMYFWLTGGLSSFLDNAPTYLVFFNLAGGKAAELMGQLAPTLMAISAGAVFMGANSYIGNAPNFMVKAVCEEQGIRMPSFFGYMVWSIAILIPLFVLLTFVFITP